MKQEVAIYRDLLADIKARIRAAQHRAALSANAEMVLLYWDIGRLIAARQEREGWGAGVIPRLAVDLKNELPEEKGFSERNIKLMVQFFKTYPDSLELGQPSVAQIASEHPPRSIGQRAVAQLPAPTPMAPQAASQLHTLQHAVLSMSWAHNVILIQKLKDLPTRLWYACQTLEQGWSRDTLILQIKNRAHERQGAAITNFTEPFQERELETGLVAHIQKFLLELGRGFAFVGRQYRLEVSDREFYLDLLFYHLHLRCFVVVDLKKGDFKPEYAGKMNFYCSAVDAQLRHAGDAPTIGLILCQTKDRILAEYSLKDIHKPIGVADYELTRALPAELASSLPSIETIEAELSVDLETEDAS